jgi:hypothetical protein
MPVARPSPRLRRPRPLTEQQLRKRLQAAQDEVAALAAGHHRTTGQIRYRLLLLERRIEEMLERWPEDLSGYGPIRHRRPWVSAGARSRVALGGSDTARHR